MRIFRKKKRELSPEEKLMQATNIVNTSLNMFKKAIDDVDKANKILEDSIEEGEKEITSLESQLAYKNLTKSKAQDQITANIGLKENLKKFQL